MKKILLILLVHLLFINTKAQEWEIVAYMPFNFEVNQLKVVNENKMVAASEFYSLLKWNGEEWSDVGGFTNNFGIPYFHYIADDNIYATKNDYLNGNTTDKYNYIAHWNGTEWSNAHSLNVAKPIGKIHVINDNEIYAVGEFVLPGSGWKVVAKYSDGAWSAVGEGDSQAGSYDTYSNLFVKNSNEIYTTSGYSDAGVIRIKKWNGENWHVYYHYQLDEAERLSRAVPGANGSVYAFGYKVSSGESCITRWNGEYWEILGNIEQDLNTHNSSYNGWLTMKYVSENEIYIVGSKLRDAQTNKFKVAKWDGESWSELGQINANGPALAMDIYDGYLYVTGDFKEPAPNGYNCTLVKRFFIGHSIEMFDVEAVANPMEGGTITGNGSYESGSLVSLTATANEGFTFLNWTENNVVVSDDNVFEFEITDHRSLVANFQINLAVADLDNSEFSIYPNPVKDILHITQSKNLPFELFIYDRNGRLMINKKIESAPSSNVNLSNLIAGNYIIELKIKNKKTIFKLIKK